MEFSSSSASKRYQSALHLRSDMIMGFEEIDGEDEIREEFRCPFCSEFFDIFGLCCHIGDEHPVEAKNGVCPVCAVRVGFDMVAHITLQHGNIFKMQRKRTYRKGGSHSTLPLMRKELRDGNLQSLFGGSCLVSSSNSAPDPLLSSFILTTVDEFVSVQPHFSPETRTTKKSSDVIQTCMLLLSSTSCLVWTYLKVSIIEMSSCLPFQLRIRKRRQKDVSLFKGCCCLQFSLIFYKTIVTGFKSIAAMQSCEPESPGTLRTKPHKQIYGSLLCL